MKETDIISEEMENCTFVFCSADRVHSIFFKNIIDYYFQSSLTILCFIETFMMHSSDHWFINPTYWKSFSKKKQEMILSEILNVDKLITDEMGSDLRLTHVR